MLHKVHISVYFRLDEGITEVMVDGKIVLANIIIHIIGLLPAYLHTHVKYLHTFIAITAKLNRQIVQKYP